MKKIKAIPSANLPPKAAAGSLSLRLSALFGGAAVLVGVGLAGALQGSALMAMAGSLGALALLVGGAVAVPLLLERALRAPLAELADGMMTLTSEKAGAIVALAGRADGIGEVARASLALLERHDHAAAMADGVRQAQGFARDLQKTTDLLKQGQSQIASGLIATADDLEHLRAIVTDGQAGISAAYARAAREAEHDIATMGAARSDVAASGERIRDVVAQLRQETAAFAAQRGAVTASVDSVTRDLGVATRVLQSHVEALGPQGHDVRTALMDIADRRASFVQVIEATTQAATRLDDVLRRVDERVGAATADGGSLKAAIEAMAPKLDEALAGVKLVGRSLPEAAQLFSSGIESIEGSLVEMRQSIDDKLDAAALATPAHSPAQEAVISDLSQSAALFKHIIAANTASIAEFQAAFDLMRVDVNNLRNSFVPVVEDAHATLDRSVEALAAIERVGVDIGSMQSAVVPMIEDVKDALDRTVETLAGLERVSVDVGAVQGAVVPMVEEVKNALDRTVETLAGLERVTADMDRQSTPAAAPALGSGVSPIQPELNQAQKLLVGFRMITRQLGEEVESLKAKVAAIEAPSGLGLSQSHAAPAEAGPALAARFDAIEARLSDIAAQLQAPPARHGEILPPAQDLGPEQQSFQRLLAGFRILMRNISNESERLQQSVSRIAEDSEGVAGLGAMAPSPHAERLEQMLGSMGELVAQLGERLRDAPMGGQRMALAGPVFEAEKASFERVLVGFRLLMRDLGQEADKLRGALSTLPADGFGAAEAAAHAPNALVERVDGQMQALSGSLSALLGEFEARMALPISAAADNIGFAVAESLASLEQRLSQPVETMIETARECAELLRAVKQALADAPAARAGAKAALPKAAERDAQANPVGRIHAVADRVDRWIDTVDGAIAGMSESLGDIRDGSDAATQRQLDERIAQLGDLAAQMRRETNEFVAVGAAISRDLEVRPEAEPARRSAAGGMGGLFGRKRS